MDGGTFLNKHFPQMFLLNVYTDIMQQELLNISSGFSNPEMLFPRERLL